MVILFYLSCLRHLIRSREAKNRIFLHQRPIFFHEFATCSELPSSISIVVLFIYQYYIGLKVLRIAAGCCCLPCAHCSNWTWFVAEILAFVNRLRSTHCRLDHVVKETRIQKLEQTVRALNRKKLSNRYNIQWYYQKCINFCLKKKKKKTFFILSIFFSLSMKWILII